MKNQPPAAIILAAGASSRMGGNKLLLPWRGKPLLSHAVNAAADAKEAGYLSTIIVVCGRDAQQTTTLAAPADIVINNPAYQSGIASSLIGGINALPKQCPAALVMLGDMPSVKREDIAAVIRRWNACADKCDIVIAAHNNQQGHPVLISARVFPRVQTLKGDIGARQLFGELNICTANAGAGVLIDMDTRQQMQATTNQDGFPPSRE